MNAVAKSLLGGLSVGLIALSSVSAQDSSRMGRPSPWLGGTSDTISTLLARVLGEVARDFHTGQPIYVVATLAPPQYVIAVYNQRDSAQKVAAHSDGKYGAFGPFITRRDSTYAGRVEIDSVTVFTHSSRGHRQATLKPAQIDALFLTPAATEKFLIPYYAQLYGPAVAQRIWETIQPVAGGVCHQYTRPCIPIPIEGLGPSIVPPVQPIWGDPFLPPNVSPY